MGGVCNICRHPIKDKYSLGASVYGDYCDYDNRYYGDISLSVCSECWSKMDEIFDWDYKHACEVYGEM